MCNVHEQFEYKSRKKGSYLDPIDPQDREKGDFEFCATDGIDPSLGRL